MLGDLTAVHHIYSANFSKGEKWCFGLICWLKQQGKRTQEGDTATSLEGTNPPPQDIE